MADLKKKYNLIYEWHKFGNLSKSPEEIIKDIQEFEVKIKKQHPEMEEDKITDLAIGKFFTSNKKRLGFLVNSSLIEIGEMKKILSNQLVSLKNDKEKLKVFNETLEDVKEQQFTSISISEKNLEKCNQLKRKLEDYHGKNLRINYLITNLIYNYLNNENINLDVIEE